MHLNCQLGTLEHCQANLGQENKNTNSVGVDLYSCFKPLNCAKNVPGLSYQIAILVVHRNFLNQVKIKMYFSNCITHPID